MDHQRQPGRFGGFAGQLQGGKFVAAVGRQVGAETYLDSQDDVPIGFHGLQRRADAAVAQVLQFAQGGIGLDAGHHAHRGDVEQGKEPGGADFDDVAAEPLPGGRTCRSGIHRRGHAPLQAVGIGVDPVVGDSGIDVHVAVDEAGSHQETPGIHGLAGFPRVQVLPQRNDLAAPQTDVPPIVQPMGGVDRPAVADQKVIFHGSW